MSEQEQAGGLEGVLAAVAWTHMQEPDLDQAKHIAAHLADAVRAWLLGQRDVVTNLIPLGFDLDRDPYSNAEEAADAVLAALTKADQ